jgi:hypothetical protein
MQLMGDWAKGEFIAAGKVPARTSCAPPHPAGQRFTFNVDSFATFAEEHHNLQAQHDTPPSCRPSSGGVQPQQGSILGAPEQDMSSSTIAPSLGRGLGWPRATARAVDARHGCLVGG